MRPLKGDRQFEVHAKPAKKVLKKLNLVWAALETRILRLENYKKFRMITICIVWIALRVSSSKVSSEVNNDPKIKFAQDKNVG